MSTPPTSAPRRVPPPCWTRDETLALIEAYKDRWFVLRPANLRASDWNAVAAFVPTKSPIQCRHKIEKLRKRYRSEKQRYLACPSRFFSSWDLFPLLDSLGIGLGSVSAVGFNQGRDIDEKNYDVGVGFEDDSATGFLADKDYLVTRGFSRAKSYGNIDGGFEAEINGDDDDFGDGFCVKFAADDSNLVNLGSRANSYMKIDGLNTGLYRDLRSGFGLKMKGNRNFVYQGIKVKSDRDIDDDFSPINHFDRSVSEGVDVVGEFPVRSLGDRSLIPPGFKPKNNGNIDGNLISNIDYGIDKGNGIGSKKSSYLHSVPLGFRSRDEARIDGNLKPNADFRGFIRKNTSSFGLGKKIGSGGVKRGRGAVVEMVSSINAMAEGLVKIEMMKMEMTRDIEKRRMEMELKRNQMILESQQRIVDSVAKALSVKRRKKVKVVSQNENGNGDGAERDDA
ncbi:Myb_DNA-bind_4 domain-containing protein [Cephalotus follicularis]|uniref:Myb_DNA-bind_4 domain-containing protein n=1 Tax=Cephalotus follicularis TaxID=3775 RepID=A0A1Q3C4Y8_CEPFO|nr:Myb_DNA-bind_4 domain-containing protein [Cephalotus follicularis]